MIFTSKRCYLNILTQLMSKDKLLNANYYMLDQLNNNYHMNNVKFNESDQIVPDDIPDLSFDSGLSKYNINIPSSSLLDPTPFETNLLVSGGNNADTVVSKFVKSLNQPDTLLMVYDFLFRKKTKGNNLQIVMYNCDETIIRYGHLICQYLSHNFGCDIIFVDAQYRQRDLVGQPNYVGNKANAEKIIKEIRDFDIKSKFLQMVQGGVRIDNTANNLTTWLAQFDFHNLVYIYNLLWPDDPLPPDNYTVERMIQIIISASISSFGERKQSVFDSLYSTSAFNDILNQYDESDADDFEFIGH